MTYREKLEKIMDDVSPNNEIYDFIRYVYYTAEERATMRVSKKYTEVLSAQIERAKKCRYHKTAMAVQGNIKYLYDVNYNQNYSHEFGDDVAPEI